MDSGGKIIDAFDAATGSESTLPIAHDEYE